MAASPLKVVVVGHVDHGKSTLIGRLLNDTGFLPQGRIEALKAASARRGVPFEWSFALDSLQAERDQAVTIESTQIWLKLPRRSVLLIDVPGHREFLAKMITGAAIADAALIVVDVSEGIKDQTERHAQLLKMLGIERIIVAVNKMDRAGFEQSCFDACGRAIGDRLKSVGLTPLAAVPVVATDGDNLVQRSTRMRWYGGPPVADLLDRLAPTPTPAEQPLRLPVQDVYRVDQRRLYVGRIESGKVAVGDEIMFSPSNKTAHVANLEHWPSTLAEAGAGQSVGIAIDRPLFVERGEIISHAADAPLLNRRLGATIVWLGHRPLQAGQTCRIQIGTTEAPAIIERVERVVDFAQATQRSATELKRDEIGDVLLHSPRLLALDDVSRLPRSARFVLREGQQVVAGGVTRLKDIPDLRPAATAAVLSPIAHRITRDMRAQRFGHRGGVLWFTGLSGAGKSTLAMAVEDHLFRKGYAAYVLDGDNVRSGLNSDLGFRAEDRVENIRRVGELAGLFAVAGFICITAFISPFAADRARARAAAGAAFHEIYIAADLATCERRDPKGLYRRARAGEIQDFTGISSGYEPPDAPELTVNTGSLPVEVSVETVIRYIEENFAYTEGGAP